MLPLLRSSGQEAAGQLRMYLQHLVSQGSSEASIHTELAVQLVDWAAAQMPAADPR